KVRNACAIAPALGHEWLWADTACIDKTSSAEHSEAINSMHAWCRDSVECLVYLSGVEHLVDEETLCPGRPEITGSRWFTRGWTLQELLAPINLTFYCWNLQGDDRCDMRWKKLFPVKAVD
ncbi:hypothetical protein N657DRAFT_582263, partial [Parathielavia appendiculata]